MLNEALWRPSKFIQRGGRLRSSLNVQDVAIGSRLMADMVASVYADRIPKYATGDLLDVGCGSVPLYGTYRPFVANITCVDWENCLHGTRHIDLPMDLTQRLALEDASFDTLILSDVLEHVPNPENLWHEMFRVSRPGATLLCNTPFYYWLHEQPHDYYRYTNFALSRFCRIAGFNLVELSEYGGVPEVLGDILAKMLVRLPLLGSGIAHGIQSTVYWSRRRISFVERISNRSAKSWPFGYFLVARKPS